MWMSVLIGCCILFQEDPYVLVLTNGQRLTLKQAPVCAGRMCTVILENGEKNSIPAKLVDQSRTDNVNKSLGEVRRAREEAMAAAEAEAAGEEQKPKKQIVLTAEDSLPYYDRSSNAVSGSVAADSGDGDLVGAPSTSTFRSGEPVFLSRETIFRYSGHYRIEGDVRVNNPSGADKIKVYLKVKFGDGSEEDAVQEISQRLAYGETATVAFTLNQSADIVKTSYSISGNLGGSK